MTSAKYLEESEKESVIEFLSERYNPESIGQLERYPPYGEYFVTLYFNTESFGMKVENRYNHPIDGLGEKILCDFEISNVVMSGEELNVTVKVTKQ